MQAGTNNAICSESFLRQPQLRLHCGINNLWTKKKFHGQEAKVIYLHWKVLEDEKWKYHMKDSSGAINGCQVSGTWCVEHSIKGTGVIWKEHKNSLQRPGYTNCVYTYQKLYVSIWCTGGEWRRKKSRQAMIVQTQFLYLVNSQELCMDISGWWLTRLCLLSRDICVSIDLRREEQRNQVESASQQLSLRFKNKFIVRKLITCCHEESEDIFVCVK